MCIRWMPPPTKGCSRPRPPFALRISAKCKYSVPHTVCTVPKREREKDERGPQFPLPPPFPSSPLSSNSSRRASEPSTHEGAPCPPYFAVRKTTGQKASRKYTPCSAGDVDGRKKVQLVVLLFLPSRPFRAPIRPQPTERE